MSYQTTQPWLLGKLRGDALHLNASTHPFSLRGRSTTDVDAVVGFELVSDSGFAEGLRKRQLTASTNLSSSTILGGSLIEA